VLREPASMMYHSRAQPEGKDVLRKNNLSTGQSEAASLAAARSTLRTRAIFAFSVSPGRGWEGRICYGAPHVLRRGG
jgi:hypothetical protein